jgi:Domain of unknown function (DUF1707)
MTGQQPIRASDQDRERAVDVLRDAYAAGCLDGGELEQRSGKAYSARTLDDLRALLSDLPGWLLERPLVSQDRLVRSPRRVVPGLPWGFGFVLAGLCLIAVAVAWAPLAVVPVVAVWLLVMARAYRRPPRSARHRSRPRR